MTSFMPVLYVNMDSPKVLCGFKGKKKFKKATDNIVCDSKACVYFISRVLRHTLFSNIVSRPSSFLLGTKHFYYSISLFNIVNPLQNGARDSHR